MEPQIEQTSRSARLISADNTAASTEPLIIPQHTQTDTHTFGHMFTHAHTLADSQRLDVKTPKQGKIKGSRMRPSSAKGNSN